MRRLFEFAQRQQECFTTKQAKVSEFVENTHSHHVQAGNWISEHRGIYVLALFPTAARPDVVLWALWYRNRNEKVDGVCGQQTEVNIYGASTSRRLDRTTSPPDPDGWEALPWRGSN